LTIGLCVSISSLSVISLADVHYMPPIIVGLIIGLLHLLLSILVHKFESYFKRIYFTILAYLLLVTYALDCFFIREFDEI
jgi:hypothetical protein